MSPCHLRFQAEHIRLFRASDQNENCFRILVNLWIALSCPVLQFAFFATRRSSVARIFCGTFCHLGYLRIHMGLIDHSRSIHDLDVVRGASAEDAWLPLALPRYFSSWHLLRTTHISFSA